MDAVGVGAGRTVSVAVAASEVPPVPVQTSVSVRVRVWLVVQLPLVARVLPLIVQLVAFVELQVRVEEPP